MRPDNLDSSVPEQRAGPVGGSFPAENISQDTSPVTNVATQRRLTDLVGELL